MIALSMSNNTLKGDGTLSFTSPFVLAFDSLLYVVPPRLESSVIRFNPESSFIFAIVHNGRHGVDKYARFSLFSDAHIAKCNG